MNFSDTIIQEFIDKPFPNHGNVVALAEDVKEARYHEGLLSQALLQVLKRNGVVREDVTITGPELLLAAGFEWPDEKI